MQGIEFTSNELYFLLHYTRELNEKINNKYSNSVFTKIEKAFFNQNKINNNNFKQEYECQWIGE